MADGITYKPDGTITVEYDGVTVKLKRPTFGVYRYFSEALSDMSTHVQEVARRLAAIRARMESASDDDLERLSKELAAENIRMFDLTQPILADMFTQLSDKELPEVDEWPSWLAADSTIPTQFLSHWRTVPKASGGPAPN